MKNEVRVLARSELDAVLDWAANEGWNPGLYDAGIFHATDPSGYFGVFVNGRLAGAVSAVAYDNDFGFIGCFIVLPEYRGGHLGPEVGRRAMEYLGVRNIGVDGVESKVANYQAFGFKLAYHNIRFAGQIAGTDKSSLHSLVDAKQIPFDLLLAYDRRCFPAERKSFLSLWLGQPEAAALAMVEQKKLSGFGIIRKCRSGYKIGPLFADSAEIAEQLLTGLAAHIPSKDYFYLDVPDANPAALRLVEKHGMKAVFRTARMYNRECPAIALNNIFGITTFELG
ncbi:MAG: GNAT family N-acetyltransferase [Victivallaceae bacterium]